MQKTVIVRGKTILDSICNSIAKFFAGFFFSDFDVFKEYIKYDKGIDVNTFILRSLTHNLIIQLIILLALILINELWFVILFSFLSFPIFMFIVFLIQKYEFSKWTFTLNLEELFISAQLLTIMDFSSQFKDCIELIAKSPSKFFSTIAIKTIARQNTSQKSLMMLFKEELDHFKFYKKSALSNVLNLWNSSNKSLKRTLIDIEEEIEEQLLLENEMISNWGSWYLGVGGIFPQVSFLAILISGNFSFIWTLGLIAILGIFLSILMPSNLFKATLEGDLEKIRSEKISPSLIALATAEMIETGESFHEILLHLTSTKYFRQGRNEALKRLLLPVFLGKSLSLDLIQLIAASITTRLGDFLLSYAWLNIQKTPDQTAKQLFRLSHVLIKQEKLLKTQANRLKVEGSKSLLTHLLTSFSLGIITASAPIFLIISRFSAIMELGKLSGKLFSTQDYLEIFICGALLNCASSMFPASFHFIKNSTKYNVSSFKKPLSIILTLKFVFFLAIGTAYCLSPSLMLIRL